MYLLPAVLAGSFCVDITSILKPIKHKFSVSFICTAICLFSADSPILVSISLFQLIFPIYIIGKHLLKKHTDINSRLFLCVIFTDRNIIIIYRLQGCTVPVTVIATKQAADRKRFSVINIAKTVNRTLYV